MFFICFNIIYLSNFNHAYMSEYRIQVIGYTQVPAWVTFLNNNRIEALNKIPKVLNVDLTHMDFIAPYHVVSLACLIEEYHLKGIKIKFTKSNTPASSYLKELGFFNYWNEGFDRKKYHPDEVKSSFCLWQLDKEMFHAYVIYAKEYFNRHFFSGMNLEPLNVSLAELFNNVIDHSKSKVGGYVFTQYFQKKSQIVISLCDFGNGIPKTITRYLKRNKDKIVSNEEAMELAFKRGFSTESTPQNRGLGLDNISSIVKTMKSDLLIISNDIYLRQQSDGNFVKTVMKEDFPGTQVVISLNTNYLKPLEEEDIVEEEYKL